MKEININIEGYNVNGICVGCLNYNRRMFYHPDIKECFRLLADIDVPDGLEVQVCWECLAHVKSAIKFKKRVTKSYDFLIAYSQMHTFLDSPSHFEPHASSNIERTEVECYSCVTETADEEKESDVKDEKETEDKFTFELAIKEEETFEDTYYEDVPIIDNDVPIIDNEVTTDEDVQLSKLKEIETEKVKKKRQKEMNRMPGRAGRRSKMSKDTDGNAKLYEAAYAEIIKGKSVRKVANMFGIKYVYLQEYKKKHLPPNFPLRTSYSGNSFFTTDQENLLKVYLGKYAEIYPGISMKVVRKYASELGHKLDLKRPKSWVTNEMAGMDWYKNFMYKNKDFENKITNSTAEEKVKEFYDRLWRVFVRENLCSESIYCMTEVGVNIEEFRDKIWLITTQNGPVALKGSQVRFAYAANAKGYAVPPLFLLPKKEGEKPQAKSEVKTERNYEVEVKTECFFEIEVDTETCNSTNETTFNSPSKNAIDLPHLTTDSNFLVFLKHFKKYSKKSVGPKLLLLIENQTFHLSIACMEYCEANDIILLVIPSYIGQNIEPLALITSQLKEIISSLYNILVLETPEQKKSIENIPTMVLKGLLECLKPNSIQDGFKNAGIFPYNREVIINTSEGSNFE